MTISFGSGQTSGLPLVITALTQLTAQTLHTAIAGTGVPQRIRLAAMNLDVAQSHTLFVGIFATGQPLSAPTATFKIALPINEGQLSALDPNLTFTLPELVLNGASFLAVWADSASKIAVSARVDDQGGIAAVTPGSGQTSGLPLIPTTQLKAAGTLPTANDGLLLLTAPSGTNTPSIVKLSALNLDAANPHTLSVGIFASGGVVPTVAFQIALPINEGLYPSLDPLNITELVLNGSDFIQVWTDTASMIAVFANVNTQIGGGGSEGGAGSVPIVSGLVTLVQNTNQFRTNDIASSATEASHQWMAPRAGTISNLVAKAGGAIGGGATATIAVRINGVNTALSLTLANADGTNLKSSLGSVAVAQGDLVVFIATTDNAGAPAATVQAAALFT